MMEEPFLLNISKRTPSVEFWESAASQKAADNQFVFTSLGHVYLFWGDFVVLRLSGDGPCIQAGSGPLWNASAVPKNCWRGLG
jgi:hypothetical protein